jgi:hypothetical protein
MALETGDAKEIVARLGALQEANESLAAPGQTHVVPPGTYARLADLIDEPDSALAALRAFATSPDKPGSLWPTMLAPWAAYFGADELALEMYRHEVPFATGNTISRPIFRGMRTPGGLQGARSRQGIRFLLARERQLARLLPPARQRRFRVFLTAPSSRSAPCGGVIRLPRARARPLPLWTTSMRSRRRIRKGTSACRPVRA